MIPCKQLLEFDLEMVSNFSENANILEYEIKFEKNLKACDWSVWTGCRVIACFALGASLRAPLGAAPAPAAPARGRERLIRIFLVQINNTAPPPAGARGVAGGGRGSRAHQEAACKNSIIMNQSESSHEMS